MKMKARTVVGRGEGGPPVTLILAQLILGESARVRIVTEMKKKMKDTIYATPFRRSSTAVHSSLCWTVDAKTLHNKEGRK